MNKPPDIQDIEDGKASCKTYIEQTKLLTSLASAFIIAPAVVTKFTDFTINGLLIGSEILFVVSVLFGYLTLGGVTYNQRAGNYEIYRNNVIIPSRIQFSAYLVGITLFGWWSLGG